MILFPKTTLMYLVVLALTYAALTLLVTRLRDRLDIPYGDGENELLRRAIRARASFIEAVPLATLIVAAVEALGEPRDNVHLLMGALTIARVLPPVAIASGLEAAPYSIVRVAVGFTTWSVLAVAGVFLLLRLWDMAP